jgi:hypothetical protein
VLDWKNYCRRSGERALSRMRNAGQEIRPDRPSIGCESYFPPLLDDKGGDPPEVTLMQTTRATSLPYPRCRLLSGMAGPLHQTRLGAWSLPRQ